MNGAANNAYVVDLKNAVVLQTIAGFNSPQAVAVNSATNTAYVVNQGSDSVSVVPLATTSPNPLQIVESSPSITYAQSPAAGITLSIIGSGFTGSSQVVLDGTAVPTTLVEQPAGDGRDSCREFGDGAALCRLRAEMERRFRTLPG